MTSTSSPSVWREMFPRLTGLAALSMGTAILEAGVIMAMVPVGLAIAAGESVVSLRNLEFSVGTLILLGLGGIVLRFALVSLQAWFTARLISGFEARLRWRMLRAFLTARWEQKSLHSASYLQNLVTTNITRSVAMMTSVVTLLVAAGNLVVLLGAAVLVQPAYAAGVTLIGVVLFFGLRPLRKRTKRHSKQSIHSMIEFTGTMSQAVALGRDIEVYRIGERVADHLRRGIERIRQFRLRIHLYGQVAKGIYTTAVFLLIYGGLAIIWFSGMTDLAALGTIVLLLLRAATHGNILQGMVHSLGEMAPYLEQAQRELARLRAAQLPGGERELEQFESIALRDVWFAYLDAPAPSSEPEAGHEMPAQRSGNQAEAVLQGADLRIGRGELVALVGPSGVGKSTLVHVLLGLRRPQRGAVVVNETVPLHELRAEVAGRLCAYVPQDPVLLNESVAENIRFFREEIDESAVERAARLAHIHEEIAVLPEGYATLCGERGERFSGGQRQRICIARALAGRPGLLVFDEPTSALDPASDRAVHAALHELKRSAEVAILVVSHRASTHDIADRCITLQEGVIVDTSVGTDH